MKDIKKKVYHSLCIVAVIVVFIIFWGIATSEWNTDKQIKVNKLSRDVKWNVDFKKANESRSHYRSNWGDFHYIEKETITQ